MKPEKPNKLFNKETRCYYCLCEIRNDMTLFMSHDKTFCSNYHRNLVVHAKTYSEQPSSVALASQARQASSNQVLHLPPEPAKIIVELSSVKKRNVFDKMIDKLIDNLFSS
jgi:hypothetical protein